MKCRELLHGFVPNSQGRRVWSLARTSLNVKVKCQGHQVQKKQHFRPFRQPACGLCLVRHLQPLVITCSELHSHAVNCIRFCLWCCLRLFVCLCMKYLRNCWTDLCQIYREDVCPSLRRVWISWSEVKGQGYQGQISSPLKMHCNALAANDVMQQQMGALHHYRGMMGGHRQWGPGVIYVVACVRFNAVHR